MTKRKRLFRTSIDTMEAELRKLRLENQQLKEQVRSERRRGDKLESTLAIERQIFLHQQPQQVGRHLNGVAA
jgi:hypothetical protein